MQCLHDGREQRPVALCGQVDAIGAHLARTNNAGRVHECATRALAAEVGLHSRDCRFDGRRDDDNGAGYAVEDQAEVTPDLIRPPLQHIVRPDHHDHGRRAPHWRQVVRQLIASRPGDAKVHGTRKAIFGQSGGLAITDKQDRTAGGRNGFLAREGNQRGVIAGTRRPQDANRDQAFANMQRRPVAGDGCDERDMGKRQVSKAKSCDYAHGFSPVAENPVPHNVEFTR